MSWRDLGSGEVRPEHVGRRITLAGWAARRRDHGGLVFVDLRDESGICQLVANPDRAPDAAKTAHEIRNEFVLRAEGEVVRRAPDAVNPGLATGEVEVQVETLEIVSRSTPLPFQLDEEGVDVQAMVSDHPRSTSNPELDLEFMRAHHRLLQDFCAAAPHRLKGLMVVDARFIEESVEEVRA